MVHPEVSQAVDVDAQDRAPSKWQPIDTAPMDGTRVRVGHEMDGASFRLDGLFKTTGAFVGGEWVCSAAFVCTDHRLRWQPTHWMPQSGSHVLNAGPAPGTQNAR